MRWPGNDHSKDLDPGDALRDGTDFKPCRELVDRYIVRHRNYYRSRAKSIRRIFRAAGVAVILLSAALPVAATFEGKHLQFVITLLSVSVAMLTALRTFFQWDAQWRVLRQADWKLTYLLAKWETEIAALGANNGSDKDAVAITEALMTQAQEVMEDESSSFFRGLGWPHSDQDQKLRDQAKTRNKKSGKARGAAVTNTRTSVPVLGPGDNGHVDTEPADLPDPGRRDADEGGHPEHAEARRPAAEEEQA